MKQYIYIYTTDNIHCGIAILFDICAINYVTITLLSGK